MREADWLIIANAQGFEQQFWFDYTVSRRVCVCDGAYDLVKKHNVNFDVLIGDFDSICADDLAVLRESSTIEIVHAQDQNYTDLEKAIRYLDNLKPQSILIVNAMGNRIDHSYYNLRLLKRYHNNRRQLLLRTAHQQMIYLFNQSLQLSGIVGATVSVFGFASARMTSQGLRFDVDQHTLDITARDSVSNSLANSVATIQIDGCALLICDANIEFSVNV